MKCITCRAYTSCCMAESVGWQGCCAYKHDESVCDHCGSAKTGTEPTCLLCRASAGDVAASRLASEATRQRESAKGAEFLRRELGVMR